MRRMLLSAIVLAASTAACSSSHGAGTPIFGDDFDGMALGSEWSAWRKTFAQSDGTVQALAAPRDGFDYGHGGHGRGAMLFTHVGDASWTDYRFEARILVQGPDPAYNPMSIQDCDRGISVAFRVARATESWNEPADSYYVFSVRAATCGESAAGAWTLSRVNDYYFDAPTGWGSSPQGSATDLASGAGAEAVDAEWNDVAVEVRGGEITLYVNGALAGRYVDDDPAGIAAGGVGVLGWWENPVTVDRVDVLEL